jgi:hypothetical protein
MYQAALIMTKQLYAYHRFVFVYISVNSVVYFTPCFENTREKYINFKLLGIWNLLKETFQ